MKSEVELKIEKLRAAMGREGIAGVRLRGVDWFAWATAGGTSSVIMTNEAGVGEVFVTLERAFVLTNRVENPRLREEEVPASLDVAVFPWQSYDKDAAGFVRDACDGGVIASDRPVEGERALPAAIRVLKLILDEGDIARYRQLGKTAAKAMTDALALAKPEWTELELAGAGAQACWSKGLEPTLVLVAGAERGKRHRHPVAKAAKLGRYAMMVYCARAHGLYANLTRFVFFDKPTSEEKQAFEDLFKIEAAAFKATRAGSNLADVYRALANGYESVGRADEIFHHHQGGPTGFLSREAIANPSSEMMIETNMAFAWNPSLPGAKIEDTVLLGENGIEILTVDPAWPTREVDGLKRPEPKW